MSDRGYVDGGDEIVSGGIGVEDYVILVGEVVGYYFCHVLY